jgi:hypothetical protein
MSSTFIAHKCACKEPKLGIVDGDTDAVYCGNCDGVLGDLADVMVSPLNPTLNDPFWNSQLEDRSNAVVINRNHYRIGTATKPSRNNGMGGDFHRIKLFNGEVIDTVDLWHQGTVPAEYSEALPDNAKFVRMIEVKQWLTCPNCKREMNRNTCPFTSCDNSTFGAEKIEVKNV